MTDYRETAPWAVEEADQLVRPFLDQDQKVQNVSLLLATVAKALDEAYEEGLAAGLAGVAT